LRGASSSRGRARTLRPRSAPPGADRRRRAYAGGRHGWRRGAPRAPSTPGLRSQEWPSGPPRRGSAGLLERVALRRDHAEGRLPRLDERLGALLLELVSERLVVDAGLGEPPEHLLGVSAVASEDALA